MLELYDLEKLVTFKSEGTLVAASEKLLISQPALSRSMRKMCIRDRLQRERERRDRVG